MVIISKTANVLCICVDYHKLNAMTRKYHYTLLYLEKIIDKGVGHKLYLCIYCFLRYYQVVMAQEYKQNLALLLDKGPFHFDRIPFGAINVSMTFQQLMEQIIEIFWRNSSTYT